LRDQGPTEVKPKGSAASSERKVAKPRARNPASEPADSRAFPVVGVGASAGGLEAFRQFLVEVPSDCGMAFVLVQHLAPQHESRLVELLSKATPMPVIEAAQGQRVERNHVYVIAPNSDLSIAGGVLQVKPRSEARGLHLPIDEFFRSLANDRQSSAIAVVLSGTGSDGTHGLCEVKAVGGITFAQDDESAMQTGMPSSARESGCVDFVKPPGEIARQILAVRDHPYLARAASSEDTEDVELDRQFRRILAIVRQVSGADFSLYRGTTIRRRILRRLALHGHRSLSEYADRLTVENEEVEALYRDLLINVTSFFRDPDVFEALKHNVFPELARERPPRPYRIWVPGCSAGQEAYSLAMALIEFHDSQPRRPEIQIFATDLSDQAAIEKARAGVYPHSIEVELSPQRLQRFFKKEDRVYRIDRSLREMCVFARQNVASDPPFSHLDLISCRNLLIYLATPLQKRVIPTFHYALDVPGFLVLGSAETIGDYDDLFETTDRAHRIYAKRAVASRPLTHFTAEDYRTSMALAARRPITAANPVDIQKEADRVLLTRFAPPAVLVNHNFEVLQFRGRTGGYLEVPPGEPTTNVLKMAREGLFMELRSALTDAKKSGKAVRRPGVRILSPGGSREIVLEVLPVRAVGDEPGCLLIVFHEAAAELATHLTAPPADEARDPRESQPSTHGAKRELEHLRQELVATKEYLQSLAEQHDAANEELRSANEEILSSNEELQSSNEELETAREELQSTNEELTTVNEQIQSRNAELTQLNDDLTNLLSSTNFPLVMVSSDLRIRSFTPPAKRVLSLLPTDIGRPIGLIRASIDHANLETLIGDAIARVQTVEHEVRDRAGRWYTMRVSPYRTGENKIDGAVLVLVDIDQLHRDQEELRQKSKVLLQQATLIELSHDAIIVRDADHRVLAWNRGAREMYGYTMEEARGKQVDVLLHTDAEAWAALNVTLAEKGAWEGELRQRRRDGREIVVESRETLVHDGAGGRATILAIKRDITETRRTLATLEQADRQKDQFLATLAHELRNPIAPIKNAVEIMRLAGDDSGTMATVREMLDRQVRQLAGIVEDLIDVSRIVERKIELHIERVDLHAVAATAIETCREMMESCSHQLTVSLPREPLFVDVDPVRMSQVVVNLLNNAAKYTPPGGAIALTVEAERGGGGAIESAVIRVRDNGIGVASDQRERIFEIFQQGDGAPQHGMGGLGVGLTLVRSLVQMHGGTVAVSSDGVGRGSEFVVRLPAVDVKTAPAGGKSDDDASSPGDGQVRRKVLVVDDNRDQAESLRRLLSLMGHDTRVGFDGAQALKLADEFEPEIVLLDLGLPTLSGYEVARRLRADRRFDSTVLVAQTGWGQEQDRQRSRDAGFDHHMVKPADDAELRKNLARASRARPAQ
jgi:two-component system CheB/CheR fusion protein